MGAVEKDGDSMDGWRALSLRGKAAAWLISLSVDDHRRMRIILGATCWPTPEQWGHAWQQDLSTSAGFILPHLGAGGVRAAIQHSPALGA